MVKRSFIDVREEMDKELQYLYFHLRPAKEDEFTEDEKREIIGDRKAHEIMETEGRIE